MLTGQSHERSCFVFFLVHMRDIFAYLPNDIPVDAVVMYTTITSAGKRTLEGLSRPWHELTQRKEKEKQASNSQEQQYTRMLDSVLPHELVLNRNSPDTSQN